MLYFAILYDNILVSGLGSGFCKALGSRLGWRLGPSSPRSPPCVPGPALPPLQTISLGGGGGAGNARRLT